MAHHRLMPKLAIFMQATPTSTGTMNSHRTGFSTNGSAPMPSSVTSPIGVKTTAIPKKQSVQFTSASPYSRRENGRLRRFDAEPESGGKLDDAAFQQLGRRDLDGWMIAFALPLSACFYNLFG
jgi:hypothetical protein